LYLGLVIKAGAELEAFKEFANKTDQLHEQSQRRLPELTTPDPKFRTIKTRRKQKPRRPAISS